MRNTGTPAIRKPVCLYALCAVDLAMPRIIEACETDTVTLVGSARSSVALGLDDWSLCSVMTQVLHLQKVLWCFGIPISETNK